MSVEKIQKFVVLIESIIKVINSGIILKNTIKKEIKKQKEDEDKTKEENNTNSFQQYIVKKRKSHDSI